jgi:hypothetical protein
VSIGGKRKQRYIIVSNGYTSHVYNEALRRQILEGEYTFVVFMVLFSNGTVVGTEITMTTTKKDYRLLCVI